MATDGFFDNRRPAAVQKHGILARYAYYFSGRAGLRTNGRVAFVDGYAGAGRYEDGSPGSPLLLVDEAQKANLIDRSVHLEFVEEDPGRAADLRRVLREVGLPNPNVRLGRFVDVLDEIRASVDLMATFYFVDPFSLGLPFATLVHLLRSAQLPVDVVYHVSSSTVARYAARIAQAREGDRLGSMREDLDRALGPEVNWLGRFEEIAVDPSQGSAYPLAVELCREFADSVARQSGTKATVVEVKQSPTHATIYTLALFSRDSQAHWDYCDIAGAAHVDWLLRCDADDYEANLRDKEEAGLLTLFDEPAPDRADLDKRLSSSAVAYFESHILDLLRSGGEVVLLDDPAGTYGDYLGRGSEKHIRKAVKHLFAEHKIDDNGVGDFWKRPIALTP